MTKADTYTEIYLWNLHMGRLIRVLQRIELHSIRSQREQERTRSGSKKSAPD
jgi:hypothetical protein